MATETAQAWSRSIALRIHAETLLALEPPRIEQAEDEIRTAIEIQERRECRFDLAWSRLAQGHVLAAKGDRERALEAYTLAGKHVRGDGASRLAGSASAPRWPPRSTETMHFALAA